MKPLFDENDINLKLLACCLFSLLISIVVCAGFSMGHTRAALSQNYMGLDPAMVDGKYTITFDLKDHKIDEGVVVVDVVTADSTFHYEYRGNVKALPPVAITPDLTGVSAVFNTLSQSDLVLYNFTRTDVDANVLDVRGFDTSRATNMSHMFEDVKVDTLDLSNFDVRNVSDMSYMFADIHAKVIDLSGFDMSGAINTDNMFYQSSGGDIVTVYARSQADVDVLNKSLNKSPNVHISVK